MSPIECGVSECDREASIMGGGCPGPLGAVAPWYIYNVGTVINSLVSINNIVQNVVVT